MAISIFSTIVGVLSGTCDTSIQATFTVSKKFSETSSGQGYVTLEASKGTFTEQEFGDSNVVTGTFTFSKNKITLRLDSNGVNAVKAVLTEWLQNRADGQGVDLEDINFNFQKMTISAGQINKKNGALKGTIEFNTSGTVSSLVDGTATVQRKFAYSAVFTII